MSYPGAYYGTYQPYAYGSPQWPGAAYVNPDPSYGFGYMAFRDFPVFNACFQPSLAGRGFAAPVLGPMGAVPCAGYAEVHVVAIGKANGEEKKDGDKKDETKKE